MTNFKIALEDYYNTENPGRTEDYYLIDTYIVPTNKRRIVMYVAHAPLATARKVSRIYYEMPVNPIYASMFDRDAEPGETLPSVGPLMVTHDVPEEHTVSTYINAVIAAVGRGPESGHLSLWKNEFDRLDAIGKDIHETFGRRSAANKLISYWTPMRRNVMEILSAVGIKPPAANGSLPSPWHSPASASPVGAGAAAVLGPAGSPGRSSTASRRRRSAERRRRATRRKSNSDPTRLTEYNTDPVTGKRYRRRRPNSDPKDD